MFWAFCLNTLIIAMMLLAQFFESSSGKLLTRNENIRGSEQKFLYWQDFYCQKWGCGLGLPLILYVFLENIGDWHHINANIVALSLVLSAAFLIICLSDKHKPDWGFPKARMISVGGIIHLCYLCFYFFTTSSVLWWIFKGQVNFLDSIIFLLGASIYVFNWRKDIKAGHFDPLKRS